MGQSQPEQDSPETPARTPTGHFQGYFYGRYEDTVLSREEGLFFVGCRTILGTGGAPPLQWNQDCWAGPCLMSSLFMLRRRENK